MMKKVVKRLVALGAGATMLGATVMGAMAADLSSFPGDFQTDGVFNGYFVVGEAAQPIDNLAMTDVATSMWYTAAEGGSMTTLEGDTWLAETTGNFLELGEAINSIESYLDDSALAALADGSISNAKGTADYEQFLYFDENDGTTTFQEDDLDNVDFFYKIANSHVIARYLLDFTEALESDIASNQDLDDIEDKQISILGKMYTITTAKNASGGVQLTLMGGANSDVLNEGETKTYTVAGNDYEVTLLSVESTQVQFSVNGETTNKLEDGETDVLADGTNLGVTEITYQEYAGGIHTANFFLGADKIELNNGSSMKVDEETISEAKVTITSSESDEDISIDDISVNMTADDDFFVGVGEKLSEYPELEEPQVLFTQNWDIELADVTMEGEDFVGLTFSEGDDQADLKLTLYDGEVSVPLAYQNATTGDDVYGGEDDDERLVLNISNSITDEDIFFVHTANPDSATADARSYLLQYKGADDSGETNPKARIKNVVTGETYERSVASAGTFDLKLGGTTFNFANASTMVDTDDFAIKYTSGGATGYTKSTDTGTLKLRTAANNEVTITAVNESLASADWYVTVLVDDTDKFDDATDAGVTVLNTSITGSSGELSSDDLGVTFGSLITDPDNDDVSWARSVYGETLTATASDSAPTKYEVSIPDTQAQVMLYVTSGAVASATSATGGSLALVSVVDATKLDTEVTSVGAQNLVVVGGPCVNSVAAELLGNPADCTEGFTPGKARIKMFDTGAGNMAMLVAGYSGEDTRLAGKVLAHRASELSGEEVEVSGTTYSDATIGAPTVVVEEPAAEEAPAEEASAEGESEA